MRESGPFGKTFVFEILVSWKLAMIFSIAIKAWIRISILLV
jgi:hypothetical protein